MTPKCALEGRNRPPGMQALRRQKLSDEGRALAKELALLTSKPVLYIANVDDSELAPDDPHVALVKALADEEGAPMVVICGKVEAELVELPPAEREEFLRSMGMEEPGLNRLVRAGYDLLNLITYFTSGGDECRAWTVHRGDTAPKAAGVIHTDFEKGFIKAEVIRVEDLLALKTEAACRNEGKLRIEGKEYVVQDGDVMHFRFNV